MDTPDSPHISLIKSYMASASVPIIMDVCADASPNEFFKPQMPDWDGTRVSFAWQDESHNAGCAFGRMTVGWTDSIGRQRLLVADGCRTVITLPGGVAVGLSSLGGEARHVLLCVAATSCSHILLTRPELADWAQSALDGIPLGVSLKNDELCYQGGNSAFSALIGDSGYLGKTDFDLSWRERASVIREYNAKTMASGVPELGSYFTARGEDGAMTWLHINSMAVTDSGSFLALVTLTEDITNHIDPDDSPLYSALRDKRARRDIADQSGSAALILSKTSDAGILFITDGIRQYGYDADELTASRASFTSLIREEARAEFALFVEESLPGGKYTRDVPLSGADGGTHTARLYLRCVSGEGPPTLEGMMVDISPQTELTERLAEESLSIHERVSVMLERSRVPGGADITAEKLIDTDRLHMYQDTLAGVFEVSAEAMDAYGVGLTPQSFPNPLVEFIMEHPEPAKLLKAELEDLAREARRTGEPSRGICRTTGLHAAAVPFRSGGRHIAVWIIGHVRLSYSDGEAFPNGCNMTGAALKRAVKLYAEQPEMDEGQFLEALAEFKRMADIISVRGAKLERRICQSDEARLSAQKILHSMSRQRLLNKCHALAGAPGGVSKTIREILALVGEELGFSRTYLMEKKASGLLAVTHEWRNEDVAPIPWEYRVITFDDGNFGIYSSPGLKVVGADTPADGQRYSAADTKSSVHLPIFIEGVLKGAVVFEECARERVYFRQEREHLETLMCLISGIVLRGSAEEEAERSRAVIEAVMRNPCIAVFVYDTETFKILYANDYCAKSVGADREELVSAWDIFPDITPESGFPGASGELAELSREDKMFLVTAHRVPWIDGRQAQLVSAADITFNKEREQIIESLAYRDPLLNIPNRRQFELDLEKALRKEDGAEGFGGLVFMDLDDFKLVNDSFGHNRGDMLLKAIAGFFEGFELTANRLYRLGGDEFTLVLDGYDPERIADTVEGVWKRFQQPWKLGELSVYSTVSIGVSRFPEDGADPGELMRYADVAMYKSKYEGKNSAVYFRKGLESGVTQRMELENRLRAAVKNGFEGFEVYYQPIVRLADAKIAGSEALLRWRDAEGRLIYPDAFIPAAESLGLMSALGAFVLRTALRDMQKYCSSEFLIAVNLSMRQFQNESLPNELGDILKEAGYSHRRLVLGVSESAAAFDMQSGDNTLGALRKLGAYISLDNKGSSYNALSRVVRENIDFVNIDISLIGSMQHDEFSDTVVRASIELAKSAGCGVFCAGVEVQEQYLDLKEYGCDFAQGFFFSHAMSLEDFDAYMLRKAAEGGKKRRISTF